MTHVPGEIATIILALHVLITTKIDGKHTGELMHNLANPVWCGNQDGDKKCVCMVLVGTSDTDDVASPSVQCVNFHNVDAENNISRLKQNKSPWVARSVIEKLKIDGKSHEK